MLFGDTPGIFVILTMVGSTTHFLSGCQQLIAFALCRMLHPVERDLKHVAQTHLCERGCFQNVE